MRLRQLIPFFLFSLFSAATYSTPSGGAPGHLHNTARKARCRLVIVAFTVNPSGIHQITSAMRCTSQILRANVPFITVSPGPATEALMRATKRRRVEEPSAALECTKVSQNFDMGSVFAELPTNDEAFPSIAWDCEDAFGTESSPLSFPSFLHFDEINTSPSKRQRTSSRQGLVRSKAIGHFDSVVSSLSSSRCFDLESSKNLAQDLGDSVLQRTKLSQACHEIESAKFLLQDFLKECQPASS
jgi:hypothetical protein